MTKLKVSGELPNTAVRADHLPERTETGIGPHIIDIESNVRTVE